MEAFNVEMEAINVEMEALKVEMESLKVEMEALDVEMAALNKNEGIIGILDLPEQIFRYIFRYISIHELFCTMRKVNPNVKKYVDDYLPLVGVFLLINERDLNTRLIHIFKPKGSNFVMISDMAQPFPVSDHSSVLCPMLNLSPHLKIENEELDMFPLALPSSNIQGPLLFGLHYRIPCRSDASAKVATKFHGFDVEKSHWKLLKTRYANINGKIVSCHIFTEEDGFVKAENHKHSVEEQERVFSRHFDSSTIVLLS